MTVDGTNDEKIKQECLAQYTVPPPSVVEPTPQTPVVNTPDTVASINEDDYKEEVNELENEKNDFEVSNEGQDDGERDGIFDIFHLLFSLYLVYNKRTRKTFFKKLKTSFLS